MAILVTGAAGFIGMHVCAALLRRGEPVIGIDNLSPYYDVALKRARVAQLTPESSFTFHQVSVADRSDLSAVFKQHPKVDRVVHLAAQAGVRYSLEHPESYIEANIEGQFAVLEACRHLDGLQHLVYASSSSVYGGNTKLPFAVDDPVDKPISLYAATKRSAELMSYCYGHLFGIPQTGLRFFTVYGPWGRPDMSAWLFTDAILRGEPIRVFNDGDMQRDFTFIDDIVGGVLNAIDRPPDPGTTEGPPHRVYNLGNHRSEELMRFIKLIEKAAGKKAQIRFEPIQPGDVKQTYADIDASRRDLEFEPKTTIDEGIPRFVAWFKDYHGL